jgi:hypothetical protein
MPAFAGPGIQAITAPALVVAGDSDVGHPVWRVLDVAAVAAAHDLTPLDHERVASPHCTMRAGSVIARQA